MDKLETYLFFVLACVVLFCVYQIVDLILQLPLPVE